MVVRTVVALVIGRIVVASEAVGRIAVERRIVVVRTVVADHMVVAAAGELVRMKVASEIAHIPTWEVEPWTVVAVVVADPCQAACRIHQSYLAGCSKVPWLPGLSS